MTHSKDRLPYEFDRETKIAALERAQYKCEKCGKSDDRTDRLQIHHLIAIWFCKETGSLGLEVIKSLANTQVLCCSCHSEVHSQESRAYYAELAPVVLQQYLAKVVMHERDDWRQKLKGRYASHD